MWAPPNDPAYIARLERGTVGFRLICTNRGGRQAQAEPESRPTEVVDTIITELSGEGPWLNLALAAEMRRAHTAMGRAL